MRLEALKNLGFNPLKETLEEFSYNYIAKLQKRIKELEDQVTSLKFSRLTPQEAISNLIKNKKIKGKQARFLIILSSLRPVLENNLMKTLDLKSSNALSVLKKAVVDKLGNTTSYIKIQALHGKGGMNGYKLTINYPYLKSLK